MRTPKLYFNDKLRVSDDQLIDRLDYTNNNVYRVTWIGDPTANWLLADPVAGVASFKTKKEAVKEGRRMAKEAAPSVLIVERKKQSKFGQSGVADWTHYSSR